MDKASSLNEELLLNIFSLMNSVKQLTTCRLVCKAWSGPAIREILGRRIHINSESKAIKLYRYFVANPSQSKYIKHVHFTLNNAALPLVITELLPVLINPNIRKLTGTVKSDMFFNTLFAIVDNAQLTNLQTLPVYSGRNSGVCYERILRLKSTTISLKVPLINFTAGSLWNFVRQFHQFPKLTKLEINGYVRNLLELETVLKGCAHLVKLTIHDFEFKELPANGMQIRDLNRWLYGNSITKVTSLKTLKVQSTCRPEFVEYLLYKYPNIGLFTFEGNLWHPNGSIAICNGNLDRILNATARVPCKKDMTLILPSQTRMRDALHFSIGRLENITYDLKENQGKDQLVMKIQDN